MIVTVVTVVFTHDLSKGVFAGVLLSAVFFVAKISKLHITSTESQAGTWIYRIKGQIFFASVTDFIQAFDQKKISKLLSLICLKRVYGTNQVWPRLNV